MLKRDHRRKAQRQWASPTVLGTPPTKSGAASPAQLHLRALVMLCFATALYLLLVDCALLEHRMNMGQIMHGRVQSQIFVGPTETLAGPRFGLCLKNTCKQPSLVEASVPGMSLAVGHAVLHTFYGRVYKRSQTPAEWRVSRMRQVQGCGHVLFWERFTRAQITLCSVYCRLGISSTPCPGAPCRPDVRSPCPASSTSPHTDTPHATLEDADGASITPARSTSRTQLSVKAVQLPISGKLPQNTNQHPH
jgi:hypothetical protein